MEVRTFKCVSLNELCKAGRLPVSYAIYVMRLRSLLLLGLCPCLVVMWSSLVCLWGCRGTLRVYGGCCDCDACTIVCVACVYADRL